MRVFAIVNGTVAAAARPLARPPVKKASKLVSWMVSLPATHYTKDSSQLTQSRWLSGYSAVHVANVTTIPRNLIDQESRGLC